MTPDQLNASLVPFAALLGLRFVEVEEGRIVAEMAVRDDLCTAGGILHGGAVMAFADTLGAVATMVHLPEGAQGTTTLESKTNFLGASRAGATVRGTTTPLHRGRTTQVWQTELTLPDRDDRRVAVVTQTQLVLR